MEHRRLGTVLRRVLVVLTVLDLWSLGRHRLLDVGPLRPLAEQSPVLARLHAESRGSRVTGGRLRNLPMLVGLAPISAYRTLDVPAVQLADGDGARDIRATPVFSRKCWRPCERPGRGYVCLTRLENRVDQLLRRTGAAPETIEDPALASWLFDASWVAEEGAWARSFAIWTADEPGARAWLVSDADLRHPEQLDGWSGDPREILAILQTAAPLESESLRPEEWTISVTATDRPG